MKILIAAAILAAIAFVGQPAECVWCPTYTCYSRCSIDCACISPPGTVGGKCYGVQAIPELEELGFEVLN